MAEQERHIGVSSEVERPDANVSGRTAPEGISDEAISGGFWTRHASPVSLLLLGAILASGLAGVTGGRPSPPRVDDFGIAALGVDTPTVIRNGEFFETRIEVSADTDLSDATIAISSELWRDITINTMIPAATEESFEDGDYRFSYGPVPAGSRLLVKIDGQINPARFGGTAGAIALYDGERQIGRQPLRIRVLP